jgi:uncharacterized membrane protein
MRTVTWTPGTDSALDQLFDQLREQQHQDRTHRYWANYAADSFKFAVALTICFNDDNQPEVCSSIASRDCWPMDAYRIHNRLWKHANKIAFPRMMSDSIGQVAQSQISWLEQNTNYKMYFISRQTDNWEDWSIKNFQRFGIDFVAGTSKYLTCPNECDDSCWQRIIYNGNVELLDLWKQRAL